MRVEMVRCDRVACDTPPLPNPTTGFVSVHFDGRTYDFCSSDCAYKWEQDLVEEGERARTELALIYAAEAAEREHLAEGETDDVGSGDVA